MARKLTPTRFAPGQTTLWRNLLSRDLRPGEYCTYAHCSWDSPEPSWVHDHDHYEVFWVLKGSGHHWINNQKKELRPGTLVLIRPEDFHAFSAMPGGILEIVNTTFFETSWTAIRNRYFRSEPAFFSLKPIEEREYVVDEAKMLEIRQAARELEGGARDIFTVERYLLNVLGILRSHWLVSEERLIPQWLLQACEEVRTLRNFSGGTATFASNIAGRSPSHVARACKKYLGTTPTEIVNDARMSYAATRLVTTDDTILEIAFDCGLQNLGHFYRLFRSKFGFSPDAYRRHQRGALQPSASAK